jgi:carbon storage regulator
MLVITRREGEEVVIGDPRNPIGVVRIASIRGDRVRIAFDFPRAVEVHRREVANQIIEDPGSTRPPVVAKLNPDAAGTMTNSSAVVVIESQASSETEARA